MKYFLQKREISDIFLLMEVLKEDSKQAIEPQFLAEALASGIKIRIGQMNKAEHEGVLRDVGRYELNLEEDGVIITLLKQEISYLTAPHPFFSLKPPVPSDSPAAPETAVVRPPNIQQEFLDKAIREHQLLTLYLINGQRIKAHIEAYDSFTILLKEGDRQHLYYKHSITTINR